MSGINKRYYRGKAKEWAISMSSNDKPMLVVLFDILTEGASHSSLTWRGFFTEKTEERTIESMRFMGFEGDNLEDIVGLDKNEVELVVEDEEYMDGEEAKISAKVQFVNKLRALQVKAPLEGDGLKMFAARMKETFRRVDAAGGKRAVAPKAPAPAGPRGAEPPPLGDNDIPF